VRVKRAIFCESVEVIVPAVACSDSFSDKCRLCSGSCGGTVSDVAGGLTSGMCQLRTGVLWRECQ
jgi:hypothetical protein